MNTCTDTELRTSPDPSMASLVGDIISDAQELIKQQFVLLMREVQIELKRAKAAMISMSIGIGVAAVGAFVLVLMLVHLLDALTQIPLWGCYGIVGGILFVIGAGMLLLGRKEAADVALTPPPQTAETLKENWQWLKSQTVSQRV